MVQVENLDSTVSSQVSAENTTVSTHDNGQSQKSQKVQRETYSSSTEQVNTTSQPSNNEKQKENSNASHKNVKTKKISKRSTDNSSSSVTSIDKTKSLRRNSNTCTVTSDMKDYDYYCPIDYTYKKWICAWKRGQNRESARNTSQTQIDCAFEFQRTSCEKRSSECYDVFTAACNALDYYSAITYEKCICRIFMKGPGDKSYTVSYRDDNKCPVHFQCLCFKDKADVTGLAPHNLNLNDLLYNKNTSFVGNRRLDCVADMEYAYMAGCEIRTQPFSFEDKILCDAHSSDHQPDEHVIVLGLGAVPFIGAFVIFSILFFTKKIMKRGNDAVM